MNEKHILNPDLPIPKANTGSTFLNLLADASTVLVQLERCFDPFFRPAFDAILRDPIARLATAMIDETRKGKLLPNEAAYLDSIIDSFGKQMRLFWKP